MNNELLESLEYRINEFLEKYHSLKSRNSELAEENEKLKLERESLRSGVDSILSKLEGI